MRRKSTKSAKSNCESSFEKDLRIDSFPMISNHKHQWRKCQCCHDKRHPDYLRQQRQSRERINILKKKKSIEKEQIQSRMLCSFQENNKQNCKLNMNLNLKQQIPQLHNQEQYLLLQRQELEQIQDKIIEQQISFSPQTPYKFKDHQNSSISGYKQQINLLRSHLTSIIEAENSTSNINQINRLSHIPSPYKLSISVKYRANTYTKIQTNKQEIISNLNKLSEILL